MNRYKITLDSTQYTDPENWIDFTPTTQRHEIYRTLLTTFSENSVRLIKTAKTYVDGVYASYGPSATIDVKWYEYDYLTDAYVEVFALGRLNLSEKYRRSRDVTEVGFEPTGFVMDVLNRDEVVTNLQQLVDMNGDAITTFTNETQTVPLAQQIIDFVASFKMVAPSIFPGETFTATTEDILYIPIPMFNNELFNQGNLVTVLDISTGFVDYIPDNQLIFNYDGDVEITLALSVTVEYREPSAGTGYTLDAVSPISIVYVINNGTEVAMDTGTLPASTATPGPWPSDTLVETSVTLAGITASDEIKFYVKLEDLTGSNPPNIQITGSATAKIVQGTEYAETNCEVMFPWELFLRLCQKVTGRNDCLRSEFFGRTDGEVHTYGSDGAGAFYGVTNVKLLRGFPIATNPINASLQEIFRAFDSMFLLGLGVTYTAGVPYIVIEPLEDLIWDGGAAAMTLAAGDEGIDWEAAVNYIWGSVKCGYDKYKLDVKPSLNTPHSPRQYIVPYLSEFTPQEYQAQCLLIASGHTIELLRRQQYDDSQESSTPYDENLVVIHMQRDGGGSFEKVEDAAYSAISNIDNSATQFNLSITPARNVLRHAPLLLAGLQARITTGGFTEFLRFMSGEANTALTTTVTGDTLVSEGADLTQTQADEVASKTPLFDASQLGTTRVKLTKAQRVLIKDGFYSKIAITDSGTTYTGVIESIKEVNLNESIAEIRFLLTP